MMNTEDVWINFLQHGWLDIDAHFEWLIELESWKLKFESKDLLLAAFRQNKPLSQKPCISS